MTPENLRRAFKALKTYRVDACGNRIMINDQIDLERFAKPATLIDGHSIWAEAPYLILTPRFSITALSTFAYATNGGY